MNYSLPNVKHNAVRAPGVLVVFGLMYLVFFIYILYRIQINMFKKKKATEPRPS